MRLFLDTNHTVVCIMVVALTRTIICMVPFGLLHETRRRGLEPPSCPIPGCSGFGITLWTPTRFTALEADGMSWVAVQHRRTNTIFCHRQWPTKTRTEQIPRRRCGGVVELTKAIQTRDVAGECDNHCANDCMLCCFPGYIPECTMNITAPQIMGAKCRSVLARLSATDNHENGSVYRALKAVRRLPGFVEARMAGPPGTTVVQIPARRSPRW